MNKLLAIWAAVILGALGGCGGSAPLMKMPDTPVPTTDVISTTIKFADSKGPDADQSPSHIVKPGSSIVINVPAGLFETKSERDANSQEFKTNDFFNAAEQEIEKVFIHLGFRVISRAKFEAKLRDLRDEARCDINRDYSCLRSQVSPEAQIIMDELKLKFDHKEISASDYADQIKQFKDKLQTASAGKTRKGEEKELTDISEVIRAAQSGDTSADYILQINRFDTQKGRIITTDIRQLSDVREFSRKYPAIKGQLDDSKNNLLKCAVIGAELNAKLINVKSGEIIWIGNFESNELSSGVNQLSIELGVRTYPVNEQRIRNFVDMQNTESQRAARYDKEVEVPAWEYKTQLVPLTVISGRCEEQLHYSDETRSKLAREVARGLINTIKVSAEQPSSASQKNDAVPASETVQPGDLAQPNGVKMARAKKVS